MRIERVSRKDAAKVCKAWHYSKTIPNGGLLSYGIWEDELFVGVIVFGYGASPYLGKSEGFKASEICELVRVALSGKQKTTSRILAATVRRFKKDNPNLKAIYSFADMNQQHFGIIYQATNWFYLGAVQSQPIFLDTNGKQVHNRHVKSDKIRREKRLRTVPQLHKHKYIFPLTKGVSKRLTKLKQPYPKRGSNNE